MGGRKTKNALERTMKGVFIVCGAFAVVAVLVITVYMIISGAPAMFTIGFKDFLFGTQWAPTASDPKFGILPMILTSLVGTGITILIGVPIALMAAVFVSEVAPVKLAGVVKPAIELLADVYKRQALVSDVAGTTTDPVYKAMELLPAGPVVFIDTAGLDDTSELGEARLKKTDEVLDKTDIAVFVIRGGDTELSKEREYMARLAKKHTPVLTAYNIFEENGACAAAPIGEKTVVINAKTGEGIDALKQLIIDNAQDYEQPTITGDMVSAGDIVMLVMPQDIQAPKGRLILPQVQVTRDLLDNGCRAVSYTHLPRAIPRRQIAKRLRLVIGKIRPIVSSPNFSWMSAAISSTDA